MLILLNLLSFVTTTLLNQLHRGFADEHFRVELPAPSERGDVPVFVSCLGIKPRRVSGVELFS